jgi:hypothetical protein
MFSFKHNKFIKIMTKSVQPLKFTVCVCDDKEKFLILYF